MEHDRLDSQPITSIKGIGPLMSEKLENLNISTVSDLIHHFPSRYLDFTHPSSIKNLESGLDSVFIATISKIKMFSTGSGKLICQAQAEDSTGKINLIWFNNPFIKKLLRENEIYTIAGKPSLWSDKLCVIGPSLEFGDSLSINTKGLVPIYPQTEGVTSKWLRQKIYPICTSLDLSDPLELIKDRFPEQINLNDAYHFIHFPDTAIQKVQADKRLSLNEHLKICITNALERQKLGDSIRIKTNKALQTKSIEKFPFELTKGQTKAITHILKDLNKNEFTHRLIQGETGSGKTATIITTSDQVINSNYSVAILAPTEILANQHFSTFSKFSVFPNNVQLITGSNKEDIIQSKPMIYIGTHALLNKVSRDLRHPLAMIVIDEQHKFGVKQREQLLERSPLPHLFNLSATPIPRTIALSLIGDIELTNINSSPTNRLPTKTHIVTPTRFEKSTDWLKKELFQGNSIFVVCPNIQDSLLKVNSVETVYKKYRKNFSEETKIFTLHGGMQKEEQNRVIQSFKDTPSSILISTSLIEVGIDIPQANIMVIHSAERFGLAQLHQLRGRVGRGGAQGYFFLIPTDDNQTELERLDLLHQHSSGLVLAQKDLRLRGAGELFGIKQHGSNSVKLKYFWSKTSFQKAKLEAIRLVKNDSILAQKILVQLSNI